MSTMSAKSRIILFQNGLILIGSALGAYRNSKRNLGEADAKAETKAAAWQ